VVCAAGFGASNVNVGAAGRLLETLPVLGAVLVPEPNVKPVLAPVPVAAGVVVLWKPNIGAAPVLGAAEAAVEPKVGPVLPPKPVAAGAEATGAPKLGVVAVPEVALGVAEDPNEVPVAAPKFVPVDAVAF
jgi:hypothetical protein